MPLKCGLCEKQFSKKFNLNRHVLSAHDSSFNGFPCTLCGKKFTTRFFMKKHSTNCKVKCQSGGGISNNDLTTFQQNHDDENESKKTFKNDDQSDSVTELIKSRWTSIRTYFKCQNVVDIFNFRLYKQKHDLIHTLSKLWESKIHSQVKLQCSIGFILQHKTSHKLRYFHSSANNTQLLQTPKNVGKLSELLKVGKTISELDLAQFAINKRPDSSWCVLLITNITFTLTKLPFAKFGTPTALPDYIKRNKSIISLTSVGHKQYQDNLCFFRALALALSCKCKKRCNCISSLEPQVQNLFEQYKLSKKQKTNSLCFKGVSLNDLPFLEQLFKVQITVFSLDKHQKASIIYQSFKSLPTKLNLCAVKNHFCFIKDLSKFTKCYKCKLCFTCFSIKSRLTKHMTGCLKKKSKLIYKRDNFHPPLNIFEKIENETNIHVPIIDRHYPYFATFDIECFLPPSTVTDTSKIQFTNEHTLMSISICSNIPGYKKPLCIVSDGCVETVVENFVLYLEHLSFVAKKLCIDKFHDVFEGLGYFEKLRTLIEKKYEGFQWSNSFVYKQRSISNLIEMLCSYCGELPVIGFNSQKYDINCMRTPLIRYLLKHDKIKFVIKRSNTMKCIKTPNLKFLDILNYIAPGFNYENFIKAYNCNLKKGFFPYEYVTSLSKLNEKILPPHEAFFSSLKQSNISVHEYEHCKQVWHDLKMETLRDYLIYYNNLDVVPFIEAIEKQHQIYHSEGIDMFKDGVSVPSLATKWLFLKSETNKFSIPLISKKHADLYSTIRNNIVGGPSIVFHRYHEKQKTYLRKKELGLNSKLCQSIYGFDANALYLYCSMQKLPTGTFVRRKSEDNFRPKFSDYYGRTSLEWLEFEAMNRSTFIQHKFNKGEQRLGQHNLPVDGICKRTNTVFQFHGCLFHGCQLNSCTITRGMTINPINNKPFYQLQKDTKEKEDYIRALGYNLHVIYECQWNEMKKSNPKIKQFVNDLFSRKMEENKPMTSVEVLEAVKNDKFYGFLECDIEVPKHLQEHFSEMPPIFKHASLSRKDLSDEMLSFSQDCNILRQPQKSLISSFFGKKVLLLTTLLKWYLEHGLIVNKIYQIVQFEGYSAFTHFGETVCQMRRKADTDPSKKIIAETAKLCGNVIYGTTITNKEKFMDVKYVTTPFEASKLANSKHFIAVDELADDVYEVQLAKGRIKLDTPIVLGFAILQLAKLRMLEFYYDMMCKYFSKCDFQYVTMDTDSAYFATSGEFESLVIPAKRQEFYNSYDQWFVAPFCSDHKNLFIQCKLQQKPWSMMKCCEQVFQFHRRTPGLFKQEFKGNGIIALNSKTYFCFGNEGDKQSTKGIQKQQNNLLKKDFLHVLKSKKTVFGTNRGIVRKNHKMLSYTQIRAGLNYFYAKRKVDKDGVTTYPLNK